MLKLKRFDNVDVLCTDIDVMATFYHGILGLPFLFPYQVGDSWFAVQSGDVTLYFFPGRGAHPMPFVDNYTGNPPGIESYSFAVDDLDEAIRCLDGKVSWIGPVREWHHANGTRYRFRFFHDPEGNKVSVTQPHKT